MQIIYNGAASFFLIHLRSIAFGRYNIKKMIVFVSKCAKKIGIEVINNMNEVGEIIRHYRMKMGYSQKYLSEKVGISQAMVTLIEKGTMFPSEETIYKISKVLGISIGQRVKIYRCKRGISQSELGKKVRNKSSGLSRIESVKKR